jgi:hypothetical protein
MNSTPSHAALEIGNEYTAIQTRVVELSPVHELGEKNCIEIPEGSRVCELLLSLGERLREDAIAGIAPGDLLTLSQQIIDIVETPFLPLGNRQRAANVIAKFAAWSHGVLDLLIRSAESYALTQHIDDAFPFSPNAFEILADIDPTCEQVTAFLRYVASHEYGVAGWSASQALQVIDQRRAEVCSGGI